VYLIPFHRVEPGLAADETRFMQLFDERHGLPAGRYHLVEHYCPDPDCDCRRVMLTVVRDDRPNRSLASINYAFDREDEMPGPFIDRMNQQSKHAPALLELVKDAVLTDRRYLARLERHYALVKEATSDPDHPAYEELQALMGKDIEDISSWQPVVPQHDPAGRNDPCPCGSGKKYKYCCMRKDR